MDARELIDILVIQKEYIKTDWFAKEFGIDFDASEDILNVAVQEGILFETGMENEFGLPFKVTQGNLSPENIETFQGFINKFFKKIERSNKAKKIISPKGQVENLYEVQPYFYDKAGLWWLWDEEMFKWERVDEIDILNMISRDTDKDTISSKSRTEILNAMKQEGRKQIPKEIEPTWIQFQKKIYDIKTGESFDASAEYFVTNPIPWNIGKDTKTPALDILFESWVGEDHVKELYELIAFSIVPKYFIHRLFCLIGSGANGKSTFIQVMEKFIGNENITSSSLDRLLKERFEGTKLYNKLVCMIGETNFNLLKDTDFLKKLTGGDRVRGEYKGRDGFEFENYAKLIMATNSLPPTADKTDGFYRRWKIIDFPNKFDMETEVLHGVSNEEYENLGKKCLEILKTLWVDRRFTNDGDFEERRRVYEEKSNPLMKFIDENYKRNVNSSVSFSSFKDGLLIFLEERGHRILSIPAISKQLKNEGYEIKTQTMNGVTSKQILEIEEKPRELPK